MESFEFFFGELPQIEDALLKRTRELGAQIVLDAKRICPVDTGNLEESIHLEEVDDGVNVVVGEYGEQNADYWACVEYGTDRQRAQPYMRPAFEMNAKE